MAEITLKGRRRSPVTTWFDGEHTIWDTVDHCNYTSISRRFLDTATDWLTYCGPVGLTSLEFRKDDAISGYDAIPAYVMNGPTELPHQYHYEWMHTRDIFTTKITYIKTTIPLHSSPGPFPSLIEGHGGSLPLSVVVKFVASDSECRTCLLTTRVYRQHGTDKIPTNQNAATVNRFTCGMYRA